MPQRIHVDSTPNLAGADLDLVRRVARAPLNQLVTQRRVLIRAMIRRGFSRQDIKNFLRLTHQQVIDEENAGG